MIAAAVPAVATVAPAVVETGGIVAAEIERAAVTGGWQARTDVGGYSGTAFYHNITADTANPGSDLLEYPFTISTSGTYQLQVRSRINEGNSNTDANDGFVRLVTGAGSVANPVGSSNVATSTWYKFYMNTLNSWIWQTSNKDNDPQSLAWSLQGGQSYRLQISRRSRSHALDRFVLWDRARHSLGNTGTGQTSSGNNTSLNNLANSPDAGGVNQNPTVTLTSPANDASFAASATISLTATASDSDGTIARVQFYHGNTLIGEDTSSPYGITWQGVQPGLYSLTARAIDNLGASATSSPVTVTVNNAGSSNGVVVTGEFMRWHKTMLSFAGVQRSQTDAGTFRDYRLDVTFTRPDGQSFVVAGYFAGDGAAAESSAAGGKVWRALVLPDQVGAWTYSVSYKTGANVAYLGGGGSAGAPDGATGSFTITESDKSGDDFRAPDKGRLEYVGEHALRWRGGNGYFFKVGMNHPEVFLEYSGFAGTNSSRTYPNHVQHWQSGDPTWQNGNGKGIIGVINYLNAQRLNVHYFLLMNSQGDGKNAYPWNASENVWNYHLAKLDQWQIVFDHMMTKGVMPHFVFDEQENQTLFEHLESGTALSGFANSRKVYYREMVARFGHLNAITWNIGEESGWEHSTTYGAATSTTQRKQRAAYVRALLPYNDHLVVHNGPSSTDAIFTDLIGDPSYTGPSFQGDLSNTAHGNGRIAHWRNQSAANGRKWVVSYDEPFLNSTSPNRDTWRKNALWASLAAGGAGAELFTTADISLQDYTTYAAIYGDMRIASAFLKDYSIPFWSMNPRNDLTTSGWCLAAPGNTYVVYLPSGGSPSLTLPAGDYQVRWYDPRSGGALQIGSVTSVSGGGARSLGTPPSATTSDWAILVTTAELPLAVSLTSPAAGAVFDAPASIELAATAAATEASVARVEFYNGAVKLGEDNTAPYSFSWTNVPAGTYTLSARAVDEMGATGNSAPVTITVSGVSTPFGGVARAIPGRIEAEDFDIGGQGTAYHDTTAENLGASSYRSGEAVDLNATNDNGAAVSLEWTVAGECLHYTVAIAHAGLYDLDLRAASNNNNSANRRLRFEIEGQDLTGTIQLANTNGWSNWTTQTVTGIQLPAGTHRLRLAVIGGEVNVNWFEFRAQSPVLGVAVTTPMAEELGATPGVFTISRNFSNGPQTVQASFTGTAEAGVDYTIAPTPLQFDGDALTLAVSIHPATDDHVEGDESVILTLQPSAAYALSPAATATLTIRDHPADAWFFQNGFTESGSARDSSDPTGEGIPALVRFALGIPAGEPVQPWLPTLNLVPEAPAGAGGTTLLFRFSHPSPTPVGIEYIPQISESLASWEILPEEAETTVLPDGDRKQVEIRIPAGLLNRAFLRLGVRRQ